MRTHHYICDLILLYTDTNHSVEDSNAPGRRAGGRVHQVSTRISMQEDVERARDTGAHSKQGGEQMLQLQRAKEDLQVCPLQ